jgi:hypothetical protein
VNRAWLTLAFALVGCDRIFEVTSVAGDDARIDVGDSAIDMVDAPACYGSPQGLFQYCPDAPLVEDIALTGDLFTSSDPRCIDYVQPSGFHVCLIAARSIAIAQPLKAHGSRSLVLVAATTIVISALVDVTSTLNEPGAGYQTGCGTAGPGGDTAGGGGGGAGGSFGFVGGSAQAGGGMTSSVTAPGSVFSLIDVRGGCPGGHGGRANTSTAVRAGGGTGGGALMLVAGTEIDVLGGAIAAGGAGGRPGPITGGGGGGGSGGLIGLDAPIVRVHAPLVAAGGGGGGGGSDTSVGLAGNDGKSVPNGSASGGPGGIGSTAGQNGGNGAPGCGSPVGNGTVGGFASGTPSSSGGGGGGGACGYIRVYATTKDITAQTSPAITP